VIELVDLKSDDNIIRLVQLTDTHLNRNRGGKLLGLDTDFSLGHVLDLVRKERCLNDIVLVTGDIADNGETEAYQRAQDYFSTISGEKFWLPGNHDDQHNMLTAIAGGHELSDEILAANWQLLMLDTQVPGEVGGHLGAEQLHWLEQRLSFAEDAGRFTLICLHHPPVAIGSAWLDKQMVDDADQLFETIGKFSRVKGLLWGHVHQLLDSEHQGVKLMCTPSTCVQFALNSHDFKIDAVAPGYRWLELGPDGTINTEVCRVEGVEFEVEKNSTGYE